MAKRNVTTPTTEPPTIDVVGLIQPPKFLADPTEHDLITQAKAFEVTDATTYEIAVQNVIGLRKIIKRVEGHYDGILKPLNALRNKVLGMKTTDKTVVEQVIAILEPKAVTWKRTQDAIDRERERQAQLEADRKIREEQQKSADAMRRVAEAEHDPQMRKALIQEAREIERAPVSAPPVMIAKTVPQVAGARSAEYWWADVTDFKALVAAVARGEVDIDALCPNEPWLNAKARDQKGRMTIPGVEARSRGGIAGTGRG